MAFASTESLPFYPRPRINTDRLFMARESRGISLEQMGAHLGVNRVTYKKIEDDSGVIKPGLLEQISRITNYPVSFFYQPGHAVPQMAALFRPIIPRAERFRIGSIGNILRLELSQVHAALGIKSPGFPLVNKSKDTSPLGWATALRRR